MKADPRVRSGSARRKLTDLLAAILGSGLGLVALSFQADVSTAAWVVTPVILAILAVVHVRVLFAGGGPLRR